MAIDKSEKRRFILWRIRLANSQVAPGPNYFFPAQFDRNTSWHFPAVNPVILKFLTRAIPSKKAIGLCLAVIVASSVFYSSISPAAVARRAISRAGGVAHETYTSRFVFQDANLKPADVMGLVPYLKNVPIARDLESMPKCIVLDFKSTPRIDEKTVLELVKHLEHTIVFYSTSTGGRWRASDDMRREMQQRANRSNRK
jgi:hypothetical protein